MTCQIIIGDALETLRTLPSDSVDCCFTSPPYWGQRDYGCDGQIGLEPSLGQHLDLMVQIFEEVRRILKPAGSCWINYGDCYATTPNGRSAAETKADGADDRTFRDKPFSTVGPVYGAAPGKPWIAANGTGRFGGGNAPAGGTIKPKDLCMIPNRLAIALCDAGWFVRSEIIWGKPNPMPDSSGAYRPATAHEKIFLLTKSGDADVWRARDTGEISLCPDLKEQCPLITKPDQMAHRWIRLGSHYDAEAVRMPGAESSAARLGQDIAKQAGSSLANGGTKTNGPMKAVGGKPRGHSRLHAGFNERWDLMSKAEQSAGGRNLRNFEDDLSPLVPPAVWRIATKGFANQHFATMPPELVVPALLASGKPGSVVLDPFGGAGTTGLVAEAMGWDSILIELNPAYAAMAADRLRAQLCDVEYDGPPSAERPRGDLFDFAEGQAA